jgi:hypothetical protein
LSGKSVPLLVFVACATPPAQVIARPPVEAVVAPVDAGLVVDAEPPPRELAALTEPIDGIWDFVERCAGKEIAYTLDVQGARAELAAFGTKQSLELVSTDTGAIATPAQGGPPVFRLVRDGAALSRYSLGANSESLDHGSGDPGSFAPRCTTFAAFIAHDEAVSQTWKRIALEDISMSYPSRVFGAPKKKNRSLAFVADQIFGTDMGGQHATFSVNVSLDKRPASVVMKSKFSAIDFPESDPEGPMIAGARGVEMQLGIEGVGRHLVAVRLRNGKTLGVEIAWVSAFANEKIAMSDGLQLAIAARMMASIDYDTRP